MDNLISHQIKNNILTITLERFNKKNALTTEMYQTLCQLFEQAQENNDIHCLLLQGNEQCFCAGNDLQDFLNIEQNESLAALDFVKCLAQFNKPIVVAVAGSAVGIGTTLLLHADIVIAAENSTFALPFTQLGLCPEAASSLLLPKLIGHVKAFELLVLGERFNAHQALDMQLINHVCLPDELLTIAQSYAKKIARLPKDSMLTSRKLLKQANQTMIEQTISNEESEFTRLINTPDCKAILSSFFKKK